MSVTAHGVVMAYVLSTFFIMGFGYFVAVTALNRPLPGKGWAWAAFVAGVAGVGEPAHRVAVKATASGARHHRIECDIGGHQPEIDIACSVQENNVRERIIEAPSPDWSRVI
jgi:hypothetical protein